NAVHKIAEISTKHNAIERKINKKDFINQLKEKKKTAISRWTKELQSYKSLLKKRREQLRDNLNKNHRKRGVILDVDYLEDFDKKGIQLIEDFINKYNSKPRLNCCPLFSLVCTEDKLNEIWDRLATKKIRVERGILAGKVDINHFFREPIRNSSHSEFVIRVCNHTYDFDTLIEKAELDDLIIITDKKWNKVETLKDVNIEAIETNKINEIRYLLSLNNSL
ncbi:MAG: hypothetical protein JWQ09_4215, partial [Segetibacter sp.]|nr:hypothetical protein [Segetibacter sp.]